MEEKRFVYEPNKYFDYIAFLKYLAKKKKVTYSSRPGLICEKESFYNAIGVELQLDGNTNDFIYNMMKDLNLIVIDKDALVLIHPDVRELIEEQV